MNNKNKENKYYDIHTHILWNDNHCLEQ